MSQLTVFCYSYSFAHSVRVCVCVCVCLDDKLHYYYNTQKLNSFILMHVYTLYNIYCTISYFSINPLFVRIHLIMFLSSSCDDISVWLILLDSLMRDEAFLHYRITRKSRGIVSSVLSALQYPQQVQIFKHTVLCHPLR